MTEVNLEPEGMIIDSKPNGIFVRKLPSKLCISLVMSYAFTFEKMEQVFRGLSKKGAKYFEDNKSQLRYFLFDGNIKRITIIFGTTQCEFIRTSKSIINLFEFAGITDDIYQIQDFIQDVYRFNRVTIGNRGFKLFRDLTLDQIKGLQIPKKIEFRAQDEDNLRTLVQLLKKTRVLQLDRLEVTWPILQVVLDNVEEFPNLTGLWIECRKEQELLLSRIVDKFARQLHSLGLVEWVFVDKKNSEPWFKQLAHHILKRCSKLKELCLTPQSDFSSWAEVFNDPEVHQNFSAIEKLTISTYVDEEPQIQGDSYLSSSYLVNRNHPSVNLIKSANKQYESMLLCREVFQSMFPNLKTLQIDNGVTSINATKLFRPVEELIIGCKQTPTSDDFFSNEQLEVIKKVNFEKMEFGADKLVRLFKQFIYAPNLRSVRIDLDKANPKPILMSFLAANTPLEKLYLRGVALDHGLSFLKDIETNKSLKKLVIHFSKFNAQSTNTHFFMAGGINTSLEQLEIGFAFQINKAVPPVLNHLFSFVHVFKNLRHLALQRFPISNDGFFSSILTKIPLTKLKIKQCTLAPNVEKDLFSALCQPIQLQHLEIEMCEMESCPYQLLIAALPRNNSLLAIKMRKTTCSLVKLTQLLEVISHHKRLQTLNLPNVTHDIKSEAHILALKKAIAEMYKNPQCALTTLIIDDQKTITKEALSHEERVLKHNVLQELK